MTNSPRQTSFNQPVQPATSTSSSAARQIADGMASLIAGIQSLEAGLDRVENIYGKCITPDGRLA